MTRLTERFRHSVLLKILQPSLGGSLVSLVFAIGVLVIGRLPSLNHRLTMLYIPQAVTNVRHDIGQDIISLLTHSLHGYADNFFLVLFWVIMGIVIYSLLRGLGSIFLDFEESLEERNYLWPSYADRNTPLMTFIIKLGFRLAILILLAVYSLVVVPKILHGLNGSLDKIGDGTRAGLHSLLFLAVAWLLAQLFIILIRFLALRPRLF